MGIRDLDSLSWPRETPRLRLRPATLDDVDAVWSFRRLPDVVRHLSHDVMTREQVVARVGERIARADLSAERPGLSLLVEDRATGAVAGDAMLALSRCQSASTAVSDEWEGTIGYALTPSVHGRGWGTEVARELLRLGFEDLGLRRITADAFAENVPSNRVLSRIGMRLEAVERAAVLGKDGRWQDFNAYALLADEWLERP